MDIKVWVNDLNPFKRNPLETIKGTVTDGIVITIVIAVIVKLLN